MRLDEIDARALAATEGPWEHEPWGEQNENGDYTGGSVFDGRGEYLVVEVSDMDGTFIAHARQDVPAMSAALRAVLDLHAPETSEDVDLGDPWCVACGDTSPCPTELAIIAHLEGRPTP